MTARDAVGRPWGPCAYRARSPRVQASFVILERSPPHVGTRVYGQSNTKNTGSHVRVAGWVHEHVRVRDVLLVEDERLPIEKAGRALNAKPVAILGATTSSKSTVPTE